MPKSGKPMSQIVRAAEALEEEIAGLEAISRAARKIRLDSDKNIARAASELQEMLAMPERLGARLQEVAAAMGRMQERQQAALEPLASLAQEIQRRTALLEGHMKSFADLGKAAGELNADLAAASNDPGARARVAARLGEISEGARALFEAARADDFPGLAREADVLKQRMAALGKRLGRP
jgi:chromosome segregation ATPase